MSLKMKHSGPLCKGIWKGSFGCLKSFDYFNVENKNLCYGGYQKIKNQLEKTLLSEEEMAYSKSELLHLTINHCVIPHHLTKWSDEE